MGLQRQRDGRSQPGGQASHVTFSTVMIIRADQRGWSWSVGGPLRIGQLSLSARLQASTSARIRPSSYAAAASDCMKLKRPAYGVDGDAGDAGAGLAECSCGPSRFERATHSSTVEPDLDVLQDQHSSHKPDGS